jgi:hypothetical protein
MKVFIGKSSDFVPGRLLRPLELTRELANLHRLRQRHFEKLASLPAEIDRLEAEIRQVEYDLSEYVQHDV